jgi:hypothetical protein
LRDTLLKNYGDLSRNPGLISTLIDNIEKGDFPSAASCLWGTQKDNLCKNDEFYKNEDIFSTLDIFKGGFKERGEEIIEDFREEVYKKDAISEELLAFDFNYSLVSDRDVDSWNKFNHGISSRRFNYYTPSEIGSLGVKGGFTKNSLAPEGPVIFNSNVKPITDGRVRILAISDSFGVGDGLLSVDDTWARELEFQLNRIEDRYEVIVLAQGGAGYKEYLNWVEEGFIDAVNPDIVLFSYVRNDFNLLRDFASNINDIKLLGLDKELVFYLRCFEENDDLVGRILKRVNNFMPSIYRYYKFSRCGEEIALLDSSELIDMEGVIDSYKKIDSLINVPTFLYQIESTGGTAKLDARSKALEAISNNGFPLINNYTYNQIIEGELDCSNKLGNAFNTCEEFRANKFDAHYNRYYNILYINNKIEMIKKSIDGAIINRFNVKPIVYLKNNSEVLVADYLPNTLFVANSREISRVALLKESSSEPGSESFCVPFDRKGVVVNFNRYLTEGKKIIISSEFQRGGIGLVSRGYDKEGKEVYGKAVELKPGSSVSFIGSESVRGVVVLSNNKNCSSNDIDTSDEFLLEVEVS